MSERGWLADSLRSAERRVGMMLEWMGGRLKDPSRFSITAANGDKCVLCRQVHRDGYIGCQLAVDLALGFLDQYLLGLVERENFDVALSVRKGRLVRVCVPDKLVKSGKRRSR